MPVITEIICQDPVDEQRKYNKLGLYLAPKGHRDLIFNVRREKKFPLRPAEMVYLNQNVMSFSLTNKRLANKHTKFPYHIPVRKVCDHVLMAG